MPVPSRSCRVASISRSSGWFEPGKVWREGDGGEDGSLLFGIAAHDADRNGGGAGKRRALRAPGTVTDRRRTGGGHTGQLSARITLRRSGMVGTAERGNPEAGA